jgi:tetratricopeptide (TPR) repeat protein
MRFALCLLSVVLVMEGRAAAQTSSGSAPPADATAAPSPEDTEAARLAFERGVAAYESGSFEEALVSFQRAYELLHDPQILFNVATVADRLRRDQLALEAYEGYLAGMPAAPDRANVEARIAAIRASLASASSPEETTPPGEGTGTVAPIEPSPPPIEAPALGPAAPPEGGIALTVAGGVLALAGAGLLVFVAVDLDAASRATTWAELLGPYERVPIVSGIGWLAVGVGVGMAAVGAGWLIMGSGTPGSARADLRLGPGSLSLEGSF